MSLLSHDRYQYDSLILSKQTWAYPRQHLQQLLWCVVSVRLKLPEVEERKLCLWYTPTRRNRKELSLNLLHNVESVYFFYSNPVFLKNFFAVFTEYFSRMLQKKSHKTQGEARETNKMQLIWCLLSNFYLNMFRSSLCPSSGEQECALPLASQLHTTTAITTSAEHHMRQCILLFSWWWA